MKYEAYYYIKFFKSKEEKKNVNITEPAIKFTFEARIIGLKEFNTNTKRRHDITLFK